MPNSVIQGDKLTSNDILFPHLNLYDIFRPKPTYPKYDAEGVQVGVDGNPIPPAPPAFQPETVLLTPAADAYERGDGSSQGPSSQGTSNAESTARSFLNSLGVAGRTLAVLLNGSLGRLLVNVLTSPATVRHQRATEVLVHATLPPEVARIITQGMRETTDRMVMFQRAFDDAVTHPAARMTGTVAQHIVNNILFSEGGILGPGYVQRLAEAVAGVPDVTWQNFGIIAGEGANTAAMTLNGGRPVVMSIPRLVTTFLEIVGGMALNMVAPGQAQELASHIVTDAARITYNYA